MPCMLSERPAGSLFGSQPTEQQHVIAPILQAGAVATLDVEFHEADEPTITIVVPDSNANRLVELAGLINKGRRTAERAAARDLERMRRWGEWLLEAYELVPYGQWTHWLEDNFRWAVRTATNYMDVADGWEEIRQFGNVAELSAKAVSDRLREVREAEAAKAEETNKQPAKQTRHQLARRKRTKHPRKNGVPTKDEQTNTEDRERLILVVQKLVAIHPDVAVQLSCLLAFIAELVRSDQTTEATAMLEAAIKVIPGDTEPASHDLSVVGDSPRWAEPLLGRALPEVGRTLPLLA